MAIPEGLASQKRWLAWRDIGGHKPPVRDDGQPLKNWQRSCTTLDAAQRRAKKVRGGVGFMLGAGFGGVDLDDCRDPETGALDPRAGGVLDAHPTAYAEVSPSKRGVKVFGRGEGWVELTFREGWVNAQRKGAGYFTVTGVALADDRTELPDLDLDAVEAVFSTGNPPAAGGGGGGGGEAPKAKLPGVVPPGAQNQELFKEACRHARAGKTEAEVLAIVRAVALERCPPSPGEPPWTEQDFATIARSASRYRPTSDPFPRTESGDAEHFARSHSDSVRYDWRQKRWLRYDGVRWAPQAAGEVDRLALETTRTRAAAAIAGASDDPNWKDMLKWALAGESAARRKHLLELAQREPAVANDGSGWDADPWLLGVPNGVLDLRSGELREGTPDDQITMQARPAFEPDARCPAWEAFVADVLRDNPDLAAYVRRALGYSLTGDCREEAFFMLTGDGRNGKGTLVNTAAWVLGDYASDLAFHSLERGYAGDKSTNDLAKLTRKRLVTASESSGGRFNEARLKAITGRDPITARFLYAEEFTFFPEFKLWLSVNHLPKVRDDSVGFWSRPRRVPFLQSYVGREDKGLKDRLRGEGAGILAWMARGCLEWQASGLGAPTAVGAALEEYRHSQELLADFYADCCVFAAGARTQAAELRVAYASWCDERRLFGRHRLGPQGFAQELTKRSGAAKRERTGMVYYGIGLTTTQEAEL